jgi:hypothetical protein
MKELADEPTCTHRPALLLGAEKAGEEVSNVTEEAAGRGVLARGRCGGDGRLRGRGFDGHGFGAGGRGWRLRRGHVRWRRCGRGGRGRRYGYPRCRWFSRGAAGRGGVAHCGEVAAVAEGYGDLRVHLAGRGYGCGWRQGGLRQAFADGERKCRVGRGGGRAADGMSLYSARWRRGGAGSCSARAGGRRRDAGGG